MGIKSMSFAATLSLCSYSFHVCSACVIETGWVPSGGLLQTYIIYYINKLSYLALFECFDGKNYFVKPTAINFSRH